MVEAGSNGEGGAREAAESPRASWSVGDALWLAVAAGCFIGLGEAGALTLRGWFGELIHMTPHVLWMAPTGYSVLFVAIVLMLWLPGRVVPALRNPYVPGLVLCTLGMWGWVVMLPWPLHWTAHALLAVAVGDQMARALSRSTARLRTLSRRVGLAGVAIAGLGGVFVFSSDHLREWRALSALPEPHEEQPDVLLLVLDTVRARSLSLYGYGRSTTPFLDSLAAESTVFDMAIAPAPWTLPSHAAMFTGLWPHEQTAGWLEPFDPVVPTLSEVLAGQGLATGGFVANLVYASRIFGLDRGFARFEDFPVSPGQVLLTTSVGREIAVATRLRRALGWHELPHRKSAERIRRDYVSWLGRQGDRPVFAFLNFFDAHEPYLPPEPFDGRWAPGYDRSAVGHGFSLDRGLLSGRSSPWDTPADEVPLDLATYEEAIAYVDSELAKLFADLDRLGRLENTLVIVTSDHGEEFGEKRIFEHGSSLYLPAVHVPLLIRLPGTVPEGRRIQEPVSLRDLPSTVMDLVSLQEGYEFPGSSLRSTWEAAGSDSGTVSPALSYLEPGLVQQDWYPIARGPAMVSHVVDGHQYVCNPDGTEELYDIASDPGLVTDRLEGATSDSLVSASRGLLRRMRVPPPACPPDEGAVPVPGRVSPGRAP